MSMLPPDPRGNKTEPSLRGVASLMVEASDDPFVQQVGTLVDYLASHHEPPVTCDHCRDGDVYPSILLDSITGITLAWLLRCMDGAQ